MNSKLTKSSVDRAHPQSGDYFLWDGELKGFGIKIAKGGRKSYVCKYRVGNGRSAPTRRMTIGAHGSPWTIEQARSEARRLLGRAANGEDPAKEKQDEKNQITVLQLCDLYLENGIGTKKASTIATDHGRIERHIKPLLGKLKVCDVNRADIKRFMQDVANGKTSADVKTGQKAIPLNAGALEVLSTLPKLDGSPFVFPAHRSEGHYVGTPKVWRIVRSMAGIEDVRLHDLRHSFASIVVSGGASLPMIGALLGHTHSATTQRYAHLHDDPLRAATDAVGSQIEAALSEKHSENNVVHFNRNT